MGQPRPLFIYFSVFSGKQYNFAPNLPYGAGIQTHNLSNMSRLP